jgi:ribosomal protein S18 acetylase RimI-like enzyme
MRKSLVIRPAHEGDITALSALAIKTYCDAFGHTFTESDLAAHLQAHLSPESFAWMLADDEILLAEVDGTLAGYVQFGDAKGSPEGEKEAELRRLYVDAPYQSRGVGSALMESALHHPRLSEAATIYLEVWEHNPGARRLYRRYGFEVIGTRKFEVQSGVETDLELVMARRSPLSGETRVR